jgi:carbonic anhydrase
MIFNARPGELFIVCNVANIAPPYGPDSHAHGISAALEFGVGALRVKHIVVLGHAHAGGHRRLVGARSRQRAIYRVARQ